MDFLGKPQSSPGFMNVLMFGWEFPPHISGGLGTACYGLTKSLLKKGVHVLFVVPESKRDRDYPNSFLIGARDVIDEPDEYTASTEKVWSTRTATTDTDGRERSGGSVRYVPLNAELLPYHNPAGKNSELTHWSYSFDQGLTGQGNIRVESSSAQNNSPSQSLTAGNEKRSAIYGENLLEEVWRYAEKAKTIARKYDFDVIHCHDWMTFPAGIAARRISGKPLIVHVHSTEIDRAGKNMNKTISGIEQYGLALADQVITVSHWTKQILESRYNVPAEKIKVIHNGISPRKCSEEFSFPEIASHFVTFLGRITYQKGPNFFVEAAHKVMTEFPDAHFIVAGAGDLLPQIIQRVAQLNMSANFHFTGFINQKRIDQVWAITDVYVMPSVSEPFGIAPLEAIQGGVPVILSKQSGISEVMPHAIKVDFWKTDMLAAAICSVLRYESLSKVLRQNSQQHLSKLTWDHVADHVNATYHDLIRH
jgi:glycosyltransferase involved in cell wall biosynthesis